MSKHRCPSRRRGFTLVEVMVALGIGMGILLALTTFFASNSANQNELERSTRQIENARFALELIAEDVVHAGYYGEFSPDSLPVAPTYVPALACTGSVADLKWSLTDPTALPAVAPELPAAVEGIAAATAAACLTGRRGATEALMVRHADTGTALTPATVVAGNLYVQTSRCPSTTEPQRALVASSAASMTLRTTDCATANPSVRRVVQRTYFIAEGSNADASDGIPTLKRSEWIDGGLRVKSLAEGIENLQFEFGVDTDNNGAPDKFVGVSAFSSATPELWRNVVTVRIHLLARNLQATPGYTDPRTYVLGNVTVAPADGFKRKLMSTTVRLNNVGGRRER